MTDLGTHIIALIRLQNTVTAHSTCFARQRSHQYASSQEQVDCTRHNIFRKRKEQ